MSNPYDESQIVPFLEDCLSEFKNAGRVPDISDVIWIARMQYDAAVNLTYAESRAKHLAELDVALGLVPAPVPPIVPPVSTVSFDHDWIGNVELALRSLLSAGLAGTDGMDGQVVIDRMNAMGGLFAGGEFQQHHDGPQGYPTYGFPWFYVSFVPPGIYQIVEFGVQPAGD